MNSISHEDITGNKIYDAFSNWFGKIDRNKPYFAFVHLWDVHYDYIPPPPYDKLYDPHYQGNMSPSFNSDNKRLGPDMCTRDLEHLIALYDGEISWTDFILGKIINLLEESNDLKNTMIIITSDHGEEFLEHGKLAHDDLYDELVRVPLIIFYPKKFPKSRVELPISHIDLLPTILDVAAIKTPDKIQGKSILNLMNKKDEDRCLLTEYKSHFLGRNLKAIRTRWKLS